MDILLLLILWEKVCRQIFAYVTLYVVAMATQSTHNKKGHLNFRDSKTYDCLPIFLGVIGLLWVGGAQKAAFWYQYQT